MMSQVFCPCHETYIAGEDCVQFFYSTIVSIVDEDIHEQVEVDKTCHASIGEVSGRDGEEVTDCWFDFAKNI